MLPHSNFGVRVRGCRVVNVGERIGVKRGSGFNMNLFRALGVALKMRQLSDRVPFYRFFKQGRHR